MSENIATQNVLTKKQPHSSPRGKQLLWFGIFVAVVLIGVVFAIAFQNVRATRNALEEEVLVRQDNLLQSRTYTMKDWLKDTLGKAKLLADSELFQLFAAEVSKLQNLPMLFKPEGSEGGADGFVDDANPASRLHFMQTQLIEFIAYANFLSADIASDQGEVYLSTSTAISTLSERQKLLVKKVMENGQVEYGPVIKHKNGMSMEIYLPIKAPIYDQQKNSAPVAVLILNKLVDTRLVEYLGLDSSSEDPTLLHLVQHIDGSFQDVFPGTRTVKAVVHMPEILNGKVAFGLRQSLIDAKKVYSSGIAIDSVGWLIIAESDSGVLLGKHQAYAKTVYSVAALIALVLGLLVSAAWWWLIGREHASIHKEIRGLFSVIEEQKKLLDGINNTISDPISLTDSQGVYQYVNKAFANAVGRAEKDVVGLDIPAVFGFDTARRLNSADQHVLMTGESISVQDVIWLQSRRYIFQISKAPLRDAVTRATQGIVSVFRDITPLIEAQEKSRRVVQQTIDALVRTIEQADPFLGGHSRIMGSIALLVAKQLRLTETDTATITAAANLSQIGKMFVPREVLLKPGSLTPEEKRLMEQHVEHTRSILRNIEFDLPVVDAIYQINEHLDGKGYPQGISGSDISIHARVLAVANAFTAMARPRAYRPAIPVAEVLSILEKASKQYDPVVVQALRDVLSTPAGERIVEQAASAKL